MQDDYNRFIKRSIQQARCNYEDIFAPFGDDETMSYAAGCNDVEEVQISKMNACGGAEAAQMGKMNACDGAEAAQMGMKNSSNSAAWGQTEKKTCCGTYAKQEQEESCKRDKKYRPECEIPVMVFIEPQNFGRMYNEAEGLKRGTIFPVLDKPFYGKGGKC